MPGERILLIDDEQHIADVVEYVLKENGFVVQSARDGERGRRLFRDWAPDLVVLDLNLPGVQGLDLFREMRALRAGVPVIMLTARSEEIDRVLGLELGADDYVTKPFSARELAARVKTVLRRSGSGAAREGAARLAHGPIEMDCEGYTLLYFGRPLQLTRSEFRFVECLVRHPARVFTRDALIDRIYEEQHVVTDRSIDAYVKRLRRKFAEVRPEVDPIETVHGIGYKLSRAVERAP